jgi:hypothetical protein
VRERIVGFRSLQIARPRKLINIKFIFSKPSNERWSTNTDMWKEYDTVNDKSFWTSCALDGNNWSSFFNKLERKFEKVFGDEFADFAVIVQFLTKYKVDKSKQIQSGKYWSSNDAISPTTNEFMSEFYIGLSDNFNPNVRFKVFFQTNTPSRFLFNAQDFPNTEAEVIPAKYWHFYNVWDRQPIYITSNIATSTNNSYLGYSDTNYNPLKYYRITSNFDKFYLDLWNGLDHSFPCILPSDADNKLTLEMILLQDSTSLYT